jgi:hypothetical protein
MQIGQRPQSQPTGLTSIMLKLFELRPPLEFKPPPEKRKCTSLTSLMLLSRACLNGFWFDTDLYNYNMVFFLNIMKGWCNLWVGLPSLKILNLLRLLRGWNSVRCFSLFLSFFLFFFQFSFCWISTKEIFGLLFSSAFSQELNEKISKEKSLEVVWQGSRAFDHLLRWRKSFYLFIYFIYFYFSENHIISDYGFLCFRKSRFSFASDFRVVSFLFVKMS